MMFYFIVIANTAKKKSQHDANKPAVSTRTIIKQTKVDSENKGHLSSGTG